MWINPIKCIFSICTIILFLQITDAQWVQMNGPQSSPILPKITLGSNLFSSSNGGGVFRSSDNGKTWSIVNHGLASKNVNSLVACGLSLFAGTSGGGVFRSINNGENWEKISSLGINNIYRLGVIGSKLFAVNDMGSLYISENKGNSWVAINELLPKITTHGYGEMTCRVADILLSGSNLIIKGYYPTISSIYYLSADSGFTWREILSNLYPNGEITSIAEHDSDIIVGTTAGVFRSLDGGKSWNASNQGLKDTLVQFLVTIDQNLFCGTSREVFRSENYGLSWENFPMPEPNVSAMIECGSNLFARIGENVYQSTDKGESWKQTSTGLVTVDVNTLMEYNSMLFAGTQGDGIFFSSDSGLNWSAINSGLSANGKFITSFATSGSNIFAGSERGGVFVSKNDSKKWDSVNTGLPNGMIVSLGVKDARIYAGTYGNGIFTSKNLGADWSANNSCFEISGIYSFAVSGSKLFAAASNEGVLLLSDDNTSWTSVSSGLSSNFPHPKLATSGTALFASCQGGGVFVFDSMNRSWSEANAGFPGDYPLVNCLVSSGEKLFAGTDSGIYVSNNNNIKWIPVNSGLQELKVNSLLVSGTYLYAGIKNSGVWRFPLANSPVKKQKNIQYEKIGFKVISPTQTNPNIYITLSLKQAEHVTISIYNLSGNKIATIANSGLETGTHKLAWNSRKNAANFYLLKIKVGNITFEKNISIF